MNINDNSKTYYKMYGLNFTEITPNGYSNLVKDGRAKNNTLYIVAPTNYDNYSSEPYDVELYLGSVKLSSLSPIYDDISIKNLQPGLYEIYSQEENKDTIRIYLDTQDNSKYIEFTDLSKANKSYIIVDPYSTDVTNTFAITASGKINVHESNSIIKSHVGFVSVKLQFDASKHQFNLISDSTRALEDSEQQKNKVDSLALNNTNSKTYPSTKAVSKLMSTELDKVEKLKNKVNSFSLSDTNETTYPSTKAAAALLSNELTKVEKLSNKTNSITLNDTRTEKYTSAKAVADLVSSEIEKVEKLDNKVSEFSINDTNTETYPNTAAVSKLVSNETKYSEKTTNKVDTFNIDDSNSTTYPSTKAVAALIKVSLSNVDSNLGDTVENIINHGGYVGKVYAFKNMYDFWRDEYAALLLVKPEDVTLTDSEIEEIKNRVNNDSSIADDKKSEAIKAEKSKLLKSKLETKRQEFTNNLTPEIIEEAKTKFKPKVQRGEIFSNYKDRNLNTPYSEANAAVGWLSHARGAHTTAIGHYAETSGYKTVAGSQGSHAEGCCGTLIMELPNSLTCSKDLSGRNKPKVQLNQYFNDKAQSMIDKSVGFGDGTFDQSAYWAGFMNNHLDIDDNHLATVGYVGTVSLNSEGAKKGTYDFGGAIAFASHTEGSSCFAIGASSHAEGYATKTYSNAAHAEGAFSRAHGSYSHAEGLSTYSYAPGTHAEGIDTHAQNIGSHAEGAGTKTYGDYSHAEGYKTWVNGKTLGAALNDDNFSIAEGLKPAYENDEYSSSNRNINDFEYAKYCDAWALDWSDIFYSRLLATYNECVKLDVSSPVDITNSEYFTYLDAFKAEAGSTDTLAEFRASLNLYTFSDDDESLAANEVKLRLDNYNNLESSTWPTEDCVEFLSFIAKTFRMNAIGKYANSYRPLTITCNDKTYTYMYAADFSSSESVSQSYIDKATFENGNISPNYPYVERYTAKDGSFKYRYAHPFRVATDWAGYPLVDSNIHMYLGQGSHVEGYECQTSGNAAHAEGYKTWATAYSHAEGYECSTNGAQTSHVEGDHTRVNTYCAHAEGKYNFVSGSCSHAEGDSNTIEASTSHIQGAGNTINQYGHLSHVGGRDNFVSGENNFVHARGCRSSGYDTTIFGKFAEATGSYLKYGSKVAVDSNGIEYGRFADLFVIGNGDISRVGSDEYDTFNNGFKHSFGVDWHFENREYIRLDAEYNNIGISDLINSNYIVKLSDADTNIIKANYNYNYDNQTKTYVKVTDGSGEYIKHGIVQYYTEAGVPVDTQNYMSISNLTEEFFGYNGRVYAKLKEPTGRCYPSVITVKSRAFSVTADGTCHSPNELDTSGADYAEYYEWSDGNPNNEDRRGYFVTYDDGEKIRIANSNDDYILGVISSNPSVVGNSYYDSWQGKYLTDIYGNKLTELVDIPEQIIKDEHTGKETIIPGGKVSVYVINPEYDESKEYIPRELRPEWSAVGTHGRLVLIDDGTCQVNKYCKVAEDGTATYSDTKTDYRVVARLDETHIKIVIK